MFLKKSSNASLLQSEEQSIALNLLPCTPRSAIQSKHCRCEIPRNAWMQTGMSQTIFVRHQNMKKITRTSWYTNHGVWCKRAAQTETVWLRKKSVGAKEAIPTGRWSTEINRFLFGEENTRFVSNECKKATVNRFPRPICNGSLFLIARRNIRHRPKHVWRLEKFPYGSLACYLMGEAKIVGKKIGKNTLVRVELSERGTWKPMEMIMN